MTSPIRIIVMTTTLACVSLAVLAKPAVFPPTPVRINPQPLPPLDVVVHPGTAGRIAINPQPLPPRDGVAVHRTTDSPQINPQPLPPRD